jgi:O-antigen ligase
MDDFIWKLCLPVLVFGIMDGLFAPGKSEIYHAGHIGYLYRFKENACGHVAAIATAHSLIQYIWRQAKTNPIKPFFRLMFGIIGIFLFRSATGWVLLYFALALIVLKSRRIFLLFIGFFLLTASLIFVRPETLLSTSLGGKDPQKIASLTGRMNLYPVAINFALESPLWGFGFLADGLLTQFEAEVGWLPQNAHSGYISVFLNFGVMGLLILIFSFICVYKGFQSLLRKKEMLGFLRLSFCCQLVFAMIALGNVIESWVGDKFTLLWPFFAALAVLPSCPFYKIKS